ncbi:MAG: thiamine pyrophosphate-binding protein [Chloroflexi bacterium]|nr:thiamine pyrophosphate-binding protein [Chloroflexota bacterium]
MARVDGGYLAARALKIQGVERIFTLSGAHIDPIYRGCAPMGIPFLDTRHEQAAAHMAEGWARATGRPGVALVTAGPGLTNTISGIVNAFVSGSPMVLLAGRSPLKEFLVGVLQELDQARLVRPITKWAETCFETKRIPEYVATAFRHALSDRPGPVYLDVPMDILMGEVTEEEVFFPPPVTPPRPQGDPALIRQAAALLAGAARPVAVAGSGVWWSQADAQFRRLVEMAALPVAFTYRGIGALPSDHPLALGAYGQEDADVILSVGSRYRSLSFRSDVKVIQVDIDGAELGRIRPATVPIAGDAGAVLGQLMKEMEGRQVAERGAWLGELRRRQEEHQARLAPLWNSSAVPIHPLRLCREVRDFLNDDALFAVDGGDIGDFGRQTLRVHHMGQNLGGSPLGCLGSGLPFVLAAKAAYPQKQALILSGDGTFGLSAMEMDTAIRHRLPIVCVISNDGAWGMIKHGQEIKYGPGAVVATELGVRRYDKMVEALGGHGEFVQRPEDIRPALERAFASGLPACVNVLTDPTATSDTSVRYATTLGR